MTKPQKILPLPMPPAPVCTAGMTPPLRRPRLLLCAARHGLADYRRDRDLARILAPDMAAQASGQITPQPTPRWAIEALTRAEAAQDAARRAGTAGYSCLRHVEVLIALLAEVQLCTAP